MIRLVVMALSGAGLSLLSLVRSSSAYLEDYCATGANCLQQLQEYRGFPFTMRADETIPRFANTGPVIGNWLFWGIIAFIVFKFLSWAFGALSKVTFMIILVLIAASFFGWLIS